MIYIWIGVQLYIYVYVSCAAYILYCIRTACRCVSGLGHHGHAQRESERDCGGMTDIHFANGKPTPATSTSAGSCTMSRAARRHMYHIHFLVLPATAEMFQGRRKPSIPSALTLGGNGPAYLHHVMRNISSFGMHGFVTCITVVAVSMEGSEGELLLSAMHKIHQERCLAYWLTRCVEIDVAAVTITPN